MEAESGQRGRLRVNERKGGRRSREEREVEGQGKKGRLKVKGRKGG